MVTDTWTVIWKEMKLLLEGNNKARFFPLIFLLIFGVVLPLQTGLPWLDLPLGLAFWVVIPLALVASWVADSFAGERERHTLETLLASRLSDQSILFGKLIAGAGHAWGMALLAMVLGLVTVNLASWQGAVRLYTPAVGLGGVGVSFLTATLVANAGVLVSLRAPTVRQAQQIVGIGVMIVVWLPVLLLSFLPVQWRLAMASSLGSADLTQSALVTAALLFLLDVTLLAVVMRRFQRTRLILD